MAARFKVGVDGGGTKTDFMLLDSEGTVVAQHLTGGCNPNIAGHDAARKTVLDGLSDLLAKAGAQPGTVSVTLLCMSGAPLFWQQFAATLSGYGRVSAIDDSLPVLELATEGKPGLVLHAGTGSFVAARGPNGKIHYAGGLGWRFGDPGSAYDLGRRAIYRALLELQGWLPRTRLADVVSEQAKSGEAAAVTRYFYQHADANRQIAALAPAVLRLAGERDEPAHQVLVESCLPLLDLAHQVATKLFPDSPLDAVVCGASGIFSQTVVAEALAPHSSLRFQPVTSPPIEGVRRLLFSMSA